MPDTSAAGVDLIGVDLIKELRLRRWARQHYVSAERRSPAWHAVVLEEMRLRDVELEYQTGPIRSSSAYVPLLPGELRRYDEAHNSINQPNLLNAVSRQPAEMPYDPVG